MIESIEKLRKSLKVCTSKAGIEPNRFDTYWITTRACDMLIDEIEREISERYMEVPVDADGVPIRMYDCISEEEFAPSGGHVVGFKLYEGQPDWLVNCGAWVFARKCRHVKPRTLEDVLREMLDRNSDGVGLREFNRDFNALVEHYATEIRELMEVDE